MKGIKAELGTAGYQALLYSIKDMYTLSVTATDQGGLKAEATMAIQFYLEIGHLKSKILNDL